MAELTTSVPMARATYELLLVEDDRGDAFLVEELLADGGEAFRTT